MEGNGFSSTRQLYSFSYRCFILRLRDILVQKDPDLFVLNSSVSAEEGDTVSIQCFYSHQNQQKTKRWCRIKERSCYEAGKTSSQNSSILITDDWKRSFTVEMSGLTLSDSGWFFCSAGDLQVPVHLTVARAKAGPVAIQAQEENTWHTGSFCLSQN
ncbi:hypothetical protein DNTS_025637 [Danionella cerebrum]|uniref:Ig-like domain-containing protein n=1 Tax=Danionella cerebrum TaxID=2873325 RepID=A0A553MRH3_9TELE|nr:hypothetical protein DNTS_025637 [Danionella translucida]